MKIKFIAAACIALCSSSSFAVTLVCKTDTVANMVNTCAPEAKLFVAGSSALGGALSLVVAADLFDTTTQPIIKITDAGPHGSAAVAPLANAVSAWYGMSKAAVTGGTSKRLFVVYNKQNGSAAGVSQLLAKLGTVSEATVVSVGPIKGVASACVADAASTATVPVLNCPAAASIPTQADMAISDVAPQELYKLYAAATAKLTTLASTPLAVQGFGVAVNANLYAALQAVQNTAGQPSIRRADYASLVTKLGSIKSAGALLGNSDATVLTLDRRDDLSGTQASSNIFFADNACGINHDAKGKVIAGVLGGALDIIGAADSTAALKVIENAQGGQVTTDMNLNVGYAIGAIGLGSVPTTGATTWKFVKLDGVSPNFNADGSAADHQRSTFASGAYPFAMTAFAVTPVKKSANADTNLLIAAVTAGLANGGQHNLTGIAYLSGTTDATKLSLVHRTAGNNCSPLIK